MTENSPAVPSATLPSRPLSKARRRRPASTLLATVRTPRGAIGLAMAAAVVLIAIIGPLVAPYAADAPVTLAFGQPTGKFLLGGDYLGRDVLSRVLDGGWVLLVMAACATALGMVGGALAGVSAAYLRGVSDGFIMRVVDVILSFPQVVFALLLLSLLGPKLWLITLAVGISHAPQVARVLRSATLDISERDFVKAAELQGMRPIKVMVKEILPNLVSPITVEAGLSADLLHHHHRRAGLPRLRATATRRQLGNDDLREPDRPVAEPMVGHCARRPDRAADDRDQHLHRRVRAGGHRGRPPARGGRADR